MIDRDDKGTLDHVPVTASFSGGSLEDALRDQEVRWQKGERIRVEAVLTGYAGLRTEPEAILELIYNEAILREERGETPTLKEYQQRFPELAEMLRIQWEVDQVLAARRSDRETAAPAPKSPSAPAKMRRVGRYELQDVLGKGGMGIAYRAWDPQLKRVVALKMLLASSDAGDDELARFRTEAEAIARVRHPHIVEVFDVGEESGQPFFAMEFCAGGSLAGKLAGRPIPPREAARLVEQVAQGVAAAHAEQIIHRDLKPANVLLTQTADGKDDTEKVSGRSGKSSTKKNEKTKDVKSPAASSKRQAALAVCKVTDFGLAKHLDSDDGRTRTGAIMGTPSYMAPEQAFGRTKDLGPAVDIYALGAILYECLTGSPPFRGTTVADTLDQVRHRDVVPPSRLQPKVPRDLETICLKCLAKERHKRYASADDLADDLRRYQDGAPIKARPTPAWERAWKWMRLHPAAAAAIAIFVVASVSLLVLRESFTYELGEKHKQVVANEQKAVTQWKRAEQNQQKLISALDRLFARVGDKKLKDVPGMEELAKGLLTDALEITQELAQEQEDPDPAIRREVAHALRRLAKLQTLLGHTEKNAESLQKAVAITRQLVAEAPQNPLYQEDLAMMLQAVGIRSQGKEAILILEEARDLRAELAKSGLPKARKDHAWTLRSLANQYKQSGALEKSVASYQAAVRVLEDLVKEHADLEFRQELALTLNNFGALYLTQGSVETIPTLKRGIAIREEIRQKYPKNVDNLDYINTLYTNLAIAYLQRGQFDLILEVAEDDIKIQQQLAREYRGLPGYRVNLAVGYLNKGAALDGLSDRKGAEDALKESYTIMKDVRRDFPNGFAFRFADVCFGYAAALCNDPKKSKQAVAICDEGLRVTIAMVDEQPTIAHRMMLGRGSMAMGEILFVSEQPALARPWFEKSIPIFQSILKRSKGHSEATRYLNISLTKLNALNAASR